MWLSEWIGIKNPIILILALALSLLIGVSPIFSVSLLTLFVVAFLFWKHDFSVRLLLFLLPFHTLITSHLLPTYLHISNSITSPWREGLTVLLAIKLIASVRKQKFKANSLFMSILIFVTIGITYLISARFDSIAFYGFRTYFFGFFIFGVILSLPIGNIDKAKKTIIISAFLACVYGFIQVFILGSSFLTGIGYGENGYLHFSFYIAGSQFQRIVGPFSSPNEFALFLTLIILFTFDFYRQHKNKLYLMFIVVEVVALIYTFSRSAWISLVFAGLYYIYQSKLINVKRLVISSYFGIFGLMLFPIFFNTLFTRIVTHLLNTITFSEPSSQGHVDSLTLGIKNVFDYPLGFGLGMSGPRSQSLHLGINLINVENSYLLIAYELGIAGLIAFIIVIFSTFKFFKKHPESRILNVSLTMALLINFFFLPNIQSLDIMYLFWFLIALNLKENTKRPI